MKNKLKMNNMIGLLLVVVILVVYLATQVLAPKLKQNRLLRAQISADVTAAQSKLDSFATARDKLTSIQDVVSKYNIAIPAGRDYPSVLASLEAMAGKEQVGLSDIKPNSSGALEGGNQLDYSLTISGDYSRIRAFVKDIESNLRLMKVDSFSLVNGQNGLSASINVQTFSRDITKE